MSDKHKEISAKLRDLLRGLDDERLTKTGKVTLDPALQTTKAFSTKKEPTLRQINAKVLLKRTMSREEREAEAKRLAEASRPQYPDARVMFVQNTRCLGCKHESEGVSHPDIFLRLRRLLGTTFHPTDITYVREREFIEYPGTKLPRLVIHNTSQVQKCHKCFTNAVHWFPGQDIASPTPNQQPHIQWQSKDLLEQSLSSEKLTPSKSNMESTEKSGTQASLSTEKMEITDSQEHLPSSGSDCASSNSESLTPAHAKHTIIPTEEGVETATSLLAKLEAVMEQPILDSLNNLKEEENE